MNDETKYITELIATANVMELTRSTLLKVGLEFFPPIEEMRLDELMSQLITEAARGHYAE